MSKVVTVHGHTLELDMGSSYPNPGIRRQLDAKGEMTEIRIKYTAEKCE
jgi:hypothetical protein